MSGGVVSVFNSWPVALDLPPADWKPRWMRLRDQAARSLGGLPIHKAVRVTGNIVIEGKTSAMEWTPGDATVRARVRGLPVERPDR